MGLYATARWVQHLENHTPPEPATGTTFAGRRAQGLAKQANA